MENPSTATVWNGAGQIPGGTGLAVVCFSGKYPRGSLGIRFPDNWRCCASVPTRVELRRGLLNAGNGTHYSYLRQRTGCSKAARRAGRMLASTAMSTAPSPTQKTIVSETLVGIAGK